MRDVLTRHGRGELGGGMALVQLLLACRGPDALRRALEGFACGGEPTAASASDLLRLLDHHGDRIPQLLDIVRADGVRAAPSLEVGLEQLRRGYDAAVRTNAAASVALYSLGDPDLLATATEEAAALMTALGVAAPGRHLLDVGCGIGRFEAALAGRVGSITGVDLSPAMIATARERCAGLANVRLLETEGRDLALFGNRTFDAVIAVDSFPYLYQAGGPDFARAQLGEMARVTRPGGDLLVLNLSYRGDPERDRADARVFAADLDLELLRCGTSDLRSWDGTTFHWRQRG